MSKDFLLKYAQGRENDPDEPLPIECFYTFDKQTRQIKIESVVQRSNRPSFFVCQVNKHDDGLPNDEELNAAINEYLGNKTPIMYKNSLKNPYFDFDVIVEKSDMPFAQSEDEIYL